MYRTTRHHVTEFHLYATESILLNNAAVRMVKCFCMKLNLRSRRLAAAFSSHRASFRPPPPKLRYCNMGAVLVAA